MTECQIAVEGGVINIDLNFFGLTQVSDKPQDGKVDIEWGNKSQLKSDAELIIVLFSSQAWTGMPMVHGQVELPDSCGPGSSSETTSPKLGS